jgi:hypothetical protein
MSKLGIGIFQGKQAKYNRLILKVLYDNGPLTLWGISKQIHRLAEGSDTVKKDIAYGRTQIIQSMVSKRIRDLEKKKYVRKIQINIWILQFKGFIAALVDQEKPKPFGKAWADVIQKEVFPKLPESKNMKGELYGVKIDFLTDDLKAGWQRTSENARDFQTWLTISQRAKTLLKNGIPNLDLISNRDYIQLLVGGEQENE